MSLTIVSYVIAACDVTDKLENEVEVAGCLHARTEYPFCPMCGRPSTRKEKRWIDGCDGESLHTAGLQLRVRHTEHDGGCWLVGVPLSELQGYHPSRKIDLSAATLDDLRRNIQNSLEPLALWDPGSYGIWHVLYIS